LNRIDIFGACGVAVSMVLSIGWLLGAKGSRGGAFVLSYSVSTMTVFITSSVIMVLSIMGYFCDDIHDNFNRIASIPHGSMTLSTGGRVAVWTLAIFLGIMPLIEANFPEKNIPKLVPRWARTAIAALIPFFFTTQLLSNFDSALSVVSPILLLVSLGVYAFFVDWNRRLESDALGSQPVDGHKYVLYLILVSCTLIMLTTFFSRRQMMGFKLPLGYMRWWEAMAENLFAFGIAFLLIPRFNDADAKVIREILGGTDTSDLAVAPVSESSSVQPSKNV